MNAMQVKVCVLGGGPAGYVAAIRAAQLGASAALVERAELGGTCLNRGCIPTKALLRSADVYDTVAHAGGFGVQLPAGPVTFDPAAALRRQQTAVRTLRVGLEQLMKKNGIAVCHGEGTVEAPGCVRVAGEEPAEIRCERLILAAGSAPLIPPIPGAETPGVITSDDALRTGGVPARAVIVGGGVIGVEFAQYYRTLGGQVTIVEMREQILPGEDAEAAAALARVLKKRGVRIRTGARVEGIVQTPDGLSVRVSLPGQEEPAAYPADRVLLAAGRRLCGLSPDVAALGVRASHGAISVDAGMRTSVPHVFAAGDAVGGRLLAHLAFAQGRVAAENALGGRSSMEGLAVPACVYTEPEIASVGLGEAAARESGREVAVGRFDFRANGRSLTLGSREGFVKVIADRASGVLLGATLFGPGAGELISELTLAVSLGARAEQLADLIHPHPTLAEAVGEACADAVGRAIHK